MMSSLTNLAIINLELTALHSSPAALQAALALALEIIPTPSLLIAVVVLTFLNVT